MAFDPEKRFDWEIGKEDSLVSLWTAELHGMLYSK